ncbi:MAG TPA: 50S ribosomal protein L13 [Kiritimatiellia bacterium]|nr:50S ribosomal protein L13 [Kiritimatiellia bacterium]
MKTTLVKTEDNARAWYVVDATDKPAGRLAAEIAHLLRGKNKVTYAPNMDGGDFVVVINSSKVKLTGSKEEQKTYKNYSGFPGGLKIQNAATIRAKNPNRIIEQAVKGMLPKNKLSRTQITRLKVYPGAEHPHVAQQPVALELKAN